MIQTANCYHVIAHLSQSSQHKVIIRYSSYFMLTFDTRYFHMGTAIKHHVPDRVKPSFVILDIRALWRSVLLQFNGKRGSHLHQQDLASECPDVKKYKWWLNLLWHRMLYSCIYMTTVGIKGLKKLLQIFSENKSHWVSITQNKASNSHFYQHSKKSQKQMQRSSEQKITNRQH